MKKARVSLNWVLSTSLDVATQHVNVKDANGVTVFDTVLFATVDNVVVGDFDEGQVLHGEMFVTDDAGFVSSTVQADFTVPDFEAPAPVSNFGFTYQVVNV